MFSFWRTTVDWVHAMRPIATNGLSVCLSVCWSGSWALLKRLKWSSAVWELILVGPKSHVLYGVNIGRIRSQSWWVTSRRCSFLPNYFRHLLKVPPPEKKVGKKRYAAVWCVTVLREISARKYSRIISAFISFNFVDGLYTSQDI